MVKEDIFMNTDSQSTIFSSESETEVPNTGSPERIETEFSAMNTGISFNSELNYVFHGDMESNIKRNRQPKPTNWKQNINKKLRMEGKSYMGQKKINEQPTKTLTPSRKIGPQCASQYCINSKKRSCSLFSETIRHSIFSNFWTFDWNKKKSYVHSLVDRTPKITDRSSGVHFRLDTLVYRLWLDNKKEQVCQSMFLSTLGLKKAQVLRWVNSSVQRFNDFAKPKKVRKMNVEENTFLLSFFESLPKLPSHYCRKTTKKLYLEPIIKSKAHLYQLYQQKCIENNQKCLSIATLYKQFGKLNLSLFRPKKDLCNTCEGYKHKNIDKKIYQKHIERKDMARYVMNEDKNNAKNGRCHTICMDLQSALLSPKTNANAMYYRSKIVVHNFTIYDIATHKVKNYIWNEIDGELVASTFATCLIHFLENFSDDLKIVLYSDGCGYQNRNAIMSNAILQFVMRRKQIVFQKFLEPGHTQMEADSAHSTIERKLNQQDIFVPTQYAEISTSARINPFPYETELLSYSYFKDYSKPEEHRYKSIRPGKIKGDPTVFDIKALKYDDSGIIHYKISFSEDWSQLPRKPCDIIVNEFSQLYSSQLPITFRKWKDLQELKSVIPSEYHTFYDEIPYILGTLCDKFLSSNVSAILYLTNTELYGRGTASSQYFLQLAGYLGIPVIAWNADNSGLLRRASQTEMILQLAPSVEHQANAMLSILVRYNWHQFAIVTSQIAGHDDFVQAVRDRVLEYLEKETNFKFIIVATVMVLSEKDLQSLVGSEARILLLYCTREEAKTILAHASKLGLTGANYVWVVTQSVIGDKIDAPTEFPVGMLGVHFNTSYESLKYEISTVLRVFAYGVESFVSDPQNDAFNLSTSLSCEGVGDTAKWTVGDRFFRYLKNVTFELESKQKIEFNQEGTLKYVELQIMNLRPGTSDRQLVWEQIGIWQSWKPPSMQLDIKDIIWPGYSHKPPDGVPEKFHLKITFLEEVPYIKMTDPDPVTGKCSPDRGVPCRIATDADISGLNHSEVIRNSSYYQCCSGFCIDLLVKFAEHIGFTYDLVRVPDSKFGTIYNGKWNGLIAELMNRKADVALASLMINSEREAVVDFSVPFMDSGITILSMKRTGIISPTAFLEPFDTALWMLVGLVGIQVYSLAIFAFEWLSPLGFDMKGEAKPGARFSLFRSCWLVWARLFQASVHIDSPRGFTAKFIVHVWSMFAVVFLATYTANLAVFMITREESHKFIGIQDVRLSNPQSQKPTMKFSTVPFTHTDSLLAKHHPEMHNHMKQFAVNNVSEGVAAVRSRQLDAFIYDGPVLQYQVLQDPSSETCQLLLEGPWYAHTGYGIAFPRQSKHLTLFNKLLMEFKENGDLERLKRFYFTGPCSEEGRGHRARRGHGTGTGPLALEQFLSAFLLLACGILIACLLLAVEHFYSKCVRQRYVDKPPGCFSLLSQNMGRPFNYPYGSGAIYESGRFRNSLSIETYASNCRDPICTTNLLRTQHHLKMALLRCHQLENRLRLFADPTSRKRRSSCWPGGTRAPPSLSSVSVAAMLGGPKDFTGRNHVTSHSLSSEALDSQAIAFRYREHLYRPSLTEIAEIETVL